MVMESDLVKARYLADRLVMKAAGTDLSRMAKQLRRLLEPGPTMDEILATVAANDVKARAKLIGISRQAYYNLQAGKAKPTLATAQRLSELTGVPVEVIRAA